MQILSLVASIALFVLHGSVSAGEFDERIRLHQTSTDAFYVLGDIDGYGIANMLVDTGSTYTAIDQETLTQLQATGDAIYLSVLQAHMADGSKLNVKVYRISGISLGGGACVIRNIEVAVYPKGTRPILGLSALDKVSPFIFSTNPPALSLSNCSA